MNDYSTEWSSGVSTNLPAIRTLVLDDSSFDRKRIRRMGDGLDLKLNFEEAGSVAMLRDCLDRQSFDLFLIDYMLPEADGLAALEMIRNHRGQADSVAIMISGQADQRVAVSAMKKGFQDFIVKSDISPQSLRGAVLGALNTSRQFSRYFDRPKPDLGLEDMRHLLQLAVEDPVIRDILRRPMQEGLEAMARMVGVGWGMQASPEIAQFLIEFEQADTFEFR